MPIFNRQIYIDIICELIVKKKTQQQNQYVIVNQNTKCG